VTTSAPPTITVRSPEVTEDNSSLQVQDNAGDSSQVVGAVAESSTLLPHAATEAVLDAEVLWTLKTCISHYSYNYCSDIGTVFRKMFPDSNIASRFTCGETKCSYMLKYGLAPYFKQLLPEAVKRSPLYVILFDESLNKSTQEKQMDVHVRYWEAGEVHTRYMGSEFMGHATADDLLGKLKSSLTGLHVPNLIQVSTSGPNVNWKMFESLQQELKDYHDIHFLNVGSCGLHQVHEAFQCGSRVSTNPA